jgi:hypothetical protein
MTVDASGLEIENGVLKGANGELYLSGGNHSVLRFATGEFVVSDESIENMKANSAHRARLSQKYGTPWVQMVAPEKYRVVPEPFPIASPSSLARQYIDKGCDQLLDLAPIMRAETVRRTYYTTDTHWNLQGKIVAAREIALRAGRSAADVAAVEAEIEKAIVVSPNPFCGDLGRKLNPTQSEEILILKRPHPIRTFENGLPHDYTKPVNDGRLVLTESDAPTARGRLLIFGDSYLHQSLEVLSFHFATTIFCRTRWMHEEMILMAQPDMIVAQMAERYLGYVFRDEAAPPFHMIAYMLGRKPEPSEDEAIAIAKALGGGRELDMRPFPR